MDKVKLSAKDKLSRKVKNLWQNIKVKTLEPPYKAVQKKIILPFNQHRQARHLKREENKYNQGLSGVEKKGIYDMFVTGTITKKDQYNPAEYLVTLSTDLGERTYASEELLDRFDLGQRMLLTVFVTTRDTLDYCPWDKSSGYKHKNVVYSVPLEHRVVGIMKL